MIYHDSTILMERGSSHRNNQSIGILKDCILQGLQLFKAMKTRAGPTLPKGICSKECIALGKGHFTPTHQGGCSKPDSPSPFPLGWELMKNERACLMINKALENSSMNILSKSISIRKGKR
ncbi:hypothetical protein CsSME_00040537 [Camellia sinensis var. sinensis]